MKKPLVIQLVGLAALAVVLAVGCSDDSLQKPRVSMDSPGPARAMLGGGEDLGDVALAEDNSSVGAIVSIIGSMQSVAYESLQGDGFVGFGDALSSQQPGTHYDSALVSGCAGIAERFVGQARSTVMVGSYPHDALSASAAGPLELQSGGPGENIGVATETSCGASEVLIGWGPLGYPEDWGGGEGSVAILFDDDQSEFGLRICGGNGGQVTLQFFDRNGGLIATASVSSPQESEFGFARTGGVKDIAGVSIHNVDVGGVGYDDLVYDVSICNTCVDGGSVMVTPETFNVARYSKWVTGHATPPLGYEITGATIVSIGPIDTSIPGAVHGAGVLKFSSEEFSAFAGQLVAPGDPRMEDVSVCIEFTFSDGTVSCGSCWMIDITNDGNSGGPDHENKGSGSVSSEFDPNN